MLGVKHLESSSHTYESADEDDDTHRHLFFICFVEAGPRIGYRWKTEDRKRVCEVNWLDLEPDRESGDYERYVEELQEIDDAVTTYRGFYQPPTEEEYNRLWERNADDNEW